MVTGMQLSSVGGSGSTMRDYAQYASMQTGWDAGLIYAQWSLETGNFTSSVFRNDNNLAGIKWVSSKNNPSASGAGTVANDGGRYAHYPNLKAGVDGYIGFIRANPRYANVKNGKTLTAQATLLKEDGWATDPNYVSKVIKIAGGNADIPISQLDNSAAATQINISANQGITSKLKTVVESPITWIVLLAGLVLKP
jgi:flagellum-specific peptidoglycan hydrolase FlgJ